MKATERSVACFRCATGIVCRARPVFMTGSHCASRTWKATILSPYVAQHRRCPYHIRSSLLSAVRFMFTHGQGCPASTPPFTSAAFVSLRGCGFPSDSITLCILPCKATLCEHQPQPSSQHAGRRRFKTPVTRLVSDPRSTQSKSMT